MATHLIVLTDDSEQTLETVHALIRQHLRAAATFSLDTFNDQAKFRQLTLSYPITNGLLEHLRSTPQVVQLFVGMFKEVVYQAESKQHLVRHSTITKARRKTKKEGLSSTETVTHATVA